MSLAHDGTILLTGVAGFIGYHLAERLLAEGCRVVGVDSLNEYYDPRLKRARLDRLLGRAGFAFRQVDLADRARTPELFAAVRPRVVVHLAAQAGVRYSLQNPHAYADANLAGFLDVLEGCRHHEVAHLVYAPTSSVYGGNDKVPFAVQDRVDHPLSLYAATKKADELMSEAYAHLYRIPLTGLRFFTVYGPWGRPDMMMWIFTQKILAGEPIPVFNHGEMWRDFTYIDDIVAGVVASLDNPPRDDGLAKAGGSEKPHALYNIGNHRPEPLMRYIEVLSTVLGRPAEMRMLPMQPGDVKATFADTSELERDYGWQSTTPIEVGLPRFVEWYRQFYGA